MFHFRESCMSSSYASTRGSVLYSQWKSTHTNAGVFDCDERSLLQVMLQHGEGSLEDGVHELDSYRAERSVTSDGYWRRDNAMMAVMSRSWVRMIR